MLSEKEITQLIKQRDDAEDALAKAHFLVVGHYPEWSNMFGYVEALNQIEWTLNQKNDQITKTK